MNRKDIIKFYNLFKKVVKRKGMDARNNHLVFKANRIRKMRRKIHGV